MFPELDLVPARLVSPFLDSLMLGFVGFDGCCDGGVGNWNFSALTLDSILYPCTWF